MCCRRVPRSAHGLAAMNHTTQLTSETRFLTHVFSAQVVLESAVLRLARALHLRGAVGAAAAQLRHHRRE